jgi:hypothetical protein
VSGDVPALNLASIAVFAFVDLFIHIKERLKLFKDVVETSHVLLLLFAPEGVAKEIEFAAHVKTTSLLLVILLLVRGHTSSVVDVPFLFITQSFVSFIDQLELVSCLFSLVNVRMIFLG